MGHDAEIRQSAWNLPMVRFRMLSKWVSPSVYFGIHSGIDSGSLWGLSNDTAKIPPKHELIISAFRPLEVLAPCQGVNLNPLITILYWHFSSSLDLPSAKSQKCVSLAVCLSTFWSPPPHAKGWERVLCYPSSGPSHISFATPDWVVNTNRSSKPLTTVLVLLFMFSGHCAGPLVLHGGPIDRSLFHWALSISWLPHQCCLHGLYFRNQPIVTMHDNQFTAR